MGEEVKKNESWDAMDQVGGIFSGTGGHSWDL